jgi:hypothetical protein
VEGSCEHGNERSGSIKRREVFKYLYRDRFTFTIEGFSRRAQLHEVNLLIYRFLHVYSQNILFMGFR